MLIEAAVAYLVEGRSVFPVRVEQTRAGYSKQPLCGRPMERRFTEPELRAIWPESANAIGMECGRISGVMRLDAEGPVPWNEFGSPPDEGRFSSVSGGQGWLMEYLDGSTTSVLWRGSADHQELRIQSDGAFTVVPPSAGYHWVTTKKLAKVPHWVRDFYVSRALDELTKELRPTTRIPDKEEVVEALKHIPADDYDDWLKVGMALKTADMYSEWLEWSRTSPKFDEKACEKKWDTFTKVGRTVTLRSIPYWAERYGYSMPNKHESITELGFARVLSNLGAGQILHSSRWGWLSWDGKRWDREDADKAVARLQKEVLKQRSEAALKSLARHLVSDQDADDFKRKKSTKIRTLLAIRKHEDSKHVLGARKLAESESSLSADYKLFDQHPFLLNCINGTLDLRSCELLPHDTDHKLTQMCPVEYVPYAECTRWNQFLREVFCDDEELIDCTRRFLGYCLTGCVDHHILPIWYGTGRNGKSTMVKTVLSILGPDYASTMPSSFLAQHKNEQHPAKTVQLYGKRFTADLETDDGMRLNEEYVKRLTGGDELNARGMRENFWTFKPTHKLVLATNYEPSIRNQDIAIWGRIKKVPFNACFLGREEVGLEQKLLAESEGILRWMVEGCALWLRDGLKWPKAVEEATEAYRGEQNTVKTFMDQMTKPGNAEQRTRKSTMTAAYKAWCISNSFQAVSPKAFGHSMAKLGVESDDNYYHLTLNR